MKRFISLISPIGILIIICLTFFYQTIFFSKLPVPTDTLVGLYWPWRDLTASTNPNGVPFKNFLITDPIRQTIPWKKLGIDSFKANQLPKWNPYNFSGTSLMANAQAALLYPINVIFLLFSFQSAWSIYIIVQPILASIFLYLFLRHHAITRWVSVTSGITWAFCGFAIAWLTWGTIGHSALWFPMILLAIDKIRENVKLKSVIPWMIILAFALISTILAGHPQIAFYILLFCIAYWILERKHVFRFISIILVVIAITAVQWIPFIQHVMESSRVSGSDSYLLAGWFFPWQHLVQFIVPDFFGNPSTMNYWGIWNYGEFIGYIGLLPFIAAIYALFIRRDRLTKFLAFILFISLVFALPTFIAKFPYLIGIPVISSLQPTRLMILVDFCLVILAALGLDLYLKKPTKKIIIPISIVGFILFGSWIFVLTSPLVMVEVTKRNLIFPSMIWIGSAILLSLPLVIHRLKKNIIFLILLFICIDLFRFGWKFTPFTSTDYFFPNTEVIQFLQSQEKPFRIMTLDETIMPPNTNAYYNLESIEGYDPIYTTRYEEYIAALNRKSPNITPPFGFNRIVRASNIDSPLLGLLNTRYILAITDINSPSVELMFQSGKVKVYWNKHSLPRIYAVESVRRIDSKQQIIDLLYNPEFNAYKTAIVEADVSVEQAAIDNDELISTLFYSDSKITIKSHFLRDHFVVIGNMYHPKWKITLDKIQIPFYRTNYLFIGIVVPKGDHIIELTYD